MLSLYSLIVIGLSLRSDIDKSLKWLIEGYRFTVIKSEKALGEFENTNGNEWEVDNKSLK